MAFDLLSILDGTAPVVTVTPKDRGLFSSERVAAMKAQEKKLSAWEEYLIDRKIMDSNSRHLWC